MSHSTIQNNPPNYDTSHLSDREKIFNEEQVNEHGYRVPVAQGSKHFWGRKMDQVKYVKESDLKIGGLVREAGGVLGSVLTLGMLPAFSKDFREATFKKGWKEMKEGESFGERIIGGRTVRGIIGAIGTVGTFGFALLSKDFKRETFDAVGSGEVAKVAFFENKDNQAEDVQATDGQKEKVRQKYPGLLEFLGSDAASLTDAEAKDILHLGYSPVLPKTMQWLFHHTNPKSAENRSKLRSISGNEYMIERRRDGISSFIFIPKGDPEKICSVTISHTASGKKGEAVTDEHELLRSISNFCDAHADIEEGWKEESEKIAMTLAKRDGKDEDPSYIENLRKEIYKRKAIIVLSSKDLHARIYSDTVDRNRTDTGSFRTGTYVGLKDDTKKSMDTTHNKNLTEHKKKLKGDNLFPESGHTSDTPPLPPRLEDFLPRQEQVDSSHAALAASEEEEEEPLRTRPTQE